MIQVDIGNSCRLDWTIDVASVILMKHLRFIGIEWLYPCGLVISHMRIGLVVFYCRCNGPVVKSMLYQTIVGCISSTGRYVIPCTRSA